MLNRFLSNDVGREIIARSTSLEIRLHRLNGKLCASYELHGSVGNDPFTDEEDEDEGDLLGKEKPPNNDAEDMMFIVQLLRQFEKAER